MYKYVWSKLKCDSVLTSGAKKNDVSSLISCHALNTIPAVLCQQYLFSSL